MLNNNHNGTSQRIISTIKFTTNVHKIHSHIITKGAQFVIYQYLLSLITILILITNVNGEVVIFWKNSGCGEQIKNLGTSFNHPADCALAALHDTQCTSDKIMWSDSYGYSWGCRCCAPNSDWGTYNENWDIYQFPTPKPTPSPSLSPTPSPSPSPTKYPIQNPTISPSIIPSLSPLEYVVIDPLWIEKEEYDINCENGYTDLPETNMWYLKYCQRCPDGYAGTDGACYKCSKIQQPNHLRTDCKDKQWWTIANAICWPTLVILIGFCVWLFKYRKARELKFRGSLTATLSINIDADQKKKKHSICDKNTNSNYMKL